MGTSTARRGPQKGVFWRKAKTAAARFAAEGSPSRYPAAAVVARHILALVPLDWAEMVPAGALPAISRTAAALGVFYETWETQGWAAAREYFDLPPQAGQSWETLIPALLGALAGRGADLDEAVARTALLDHFQAMGLFPDQEAPPAASAGPPLPAVDAAWHVLALGLFHRLIADLGATLEFQAPDPVVGRQRQEALKDHILAQINLLTPMAAEVDDWQSQTDSWLQGLITLLGKYDVP